VVTVVSKPNYVGYLAFLNKFLCHNNDKQHSDTVELNCVADMTFVPIETDLVVHLVRIYNIYSFKFVVCNVSACFL